MTDKELLELAGRASGEIYTEEHNPLYRDDLALRLAVRLQLSADFFDADIYVGYTPNCNDCDQIIIPVEDDPYAAARLAIVRAAAEIGKGIEKP